MLSLMRVAKLAPAVPSWWSGLERLDQVGGRLDLSFLSVERQGHAERLSSLEARVLAIAPAQRNTGTVAHRGDRAPVGVTVERHLYRGPHFAEYWLGIEGHQDETHRALAHDGRSERFRHRTLPPGRALSRRRCSRLDFVLRAAATKEVRHGNAQANTTAPPPSRARRLLEGRREDASVSVGSKRGVSEGLLRIAPGSRRNVRDQRVPPGARGQGYLPRSRGIWLGYEAERLHDVLVRLDGHRPRRARARQV